MERKLKRIAILVLVVGCVIRLGFALQDQVYDQREIMNETFKMRITAFSERGELLPGAYFVFQTARVGSDEWGDLLTVKGDEPIPLRPEQLSLVSSQVGYGIIDSHYIVTTNGGDDWSLWEANKQLPVDDYQAKHNLWPSIEEVQIEADGTGRMRLRRFLNERERGPDLVTRDYGVHWSLDVP